MNDAAPGAGTAVARNHDIFGALLRYARTFLAERNYPAAVSCAQMAASQAFVNHGGIFASAELEAVLKALGQATVTGGPPTARRATAAPARVLHVLTSGRPTGGDTRYVWRWIQADSGRTHSVALTRQRAIPIPEVLSDAVSRSGGQVHRLDGGSDSVLEQAHELRRLAEDHDFIALHLFPDDILPLIAFADRKGLGPIYFVNHSDHTFWLGVDLSDRIVQLRESSIPLCEARRGVAANRFAFLPTPLDVRTPRRSRSEAKRQLGYTDDTIILLTIATGFKYEPAGGDGFVDVVQPVIRAHKRAVLIAVGPDRTETWKAGHRATDGRIVTFGRQSDTARFYEAADIYVDSFPFSSITSLLEAGTYGLPLATYSRYRADAQVLGAGAPGLTNAMFRSVTVDGFRQLLGRLIDDKAERLASGRATARDIREHHVEAGWRRHLEALYAGAAAIDDGTAAREGWEPRFAIDELDVLLERIYGTPSHLGSSITYNTMHLPYGTRLRLLLKLLKYDRSFSLTMLLPKRLETLVSGRLGWLRPLPGLSQWLNQRV